jgi:hypothetical protein
MKLTFTPKEILANRGCYSREQVNNLSFISKPEITLIEIMESEISIKDKRWFLLTAGEMTLDEKKELAFLCAKSVASIFNEKYPNDNRVNECLQAIQDFKDGKISRDELWGKRRAAADAADAADAAAAAAAAAAYAAADAADAAAADAADAAAAAAADAADAAAAAAADAADAPRTKALQELFISFIQKQTFVQA